MISKDTSKKNRLEIYTENGLTVEEEREIMHDADEARRGINVIEYMSVDQMLKELKK